MSPADSGESGQVALFMRSEFRRVPENGEMRIEQRAGMVHFGGILLVLTMIRLASRLGELFDIWWDYHSDPGRGNFELMAKQDELPLHVFSEDGQETTFNTENNFKKFFASLPRLLQKTKPWTPIEFDRAVRGFCAQSYPKENLWEMIHFRPEPEIAQKAAYTAEDYSGYISPELRPFYAYIPEQGHCIRIIPSILEDEVIKGEGEQHLVPAPVKTVIRCGVRWIEGLPIAPIPFIPGHGLAVPPEDTEL